MHALTAQQITRADAYSRALAKEQTEQAIPSYAELYAEGVAVCPDHLRPCADYVRRFANAYALIERSIAIHKLGRDA